MENALARLYADGPGNGTWSAQPLMTTSAASSRATAPMLLRRRSNARPSPSEDGDP